MVDKALFSSASEEWETPQDLFDRLDKIYHFTLDVCATPENAKCEKYFTKEDDGLKQSWCVNVWMNPQQCTCKVHPKPLHLHNGNEKMPEVLRDIAAHQRELVVADSEWEEIRVFLVQGMQQEVGKGAASKAEGFARKQENLAGREAKIQCEQQREGIKESQERGGQSQAQTEEVESSVFMEHGAMGGLPQQMGKQVRILWSGDDISSRPFHTAFPPRLSWDNTDQHDPIMLIVQLEKRGCPPKRLVGFGAVCPDCGKAGIAITKPAIAFMNPPYGREIGRWMEKANDAAKEGATVVCLVPARTDTQWMHEVCIPYGSIEFIKGRLKFGGAKNSAPFPSMIVVFD